MGSQQLKNYGKTPGGKDAVVIFLTNLNDPQTIADAIAHGGYDYLVKSNLSLSEIVDKVQQKLNV